MTQGLLSFGPQITPSVRLRHYQRDALAAAHDDLAQFPNTLVVMATGLGKTQVFVQLALDWTDRDILVLCHRDELIRQAQLRFTLAGAAATIEQADLQATPGAHIVIASVQTLAKEKRLKAFDPDRFGLVICDEVHHFVANTFVRPLKYFASARHIGFTATPDRGDKQALAKQWSSVAYTRDILDGIDDGYLVPVEGFDVNTKEIDLSHVKKQKGDLALGALDEAMLKAIDPIVSETLRLYPNRKGIVFLPGVSSAALACERFNQLKSHCAALITGETPTETRREIIKGCHDGRFQFLCGCGVPTEGFDWPECNMIVQARPTLSRALYAQMVGRGTRPLSNLVDFVDGTDGAEARRAAIARSEKPDLVVLNFVGNRGRHPLVTPLDILGGRFTDKEIARAKKKAERSGKPKNLLTLLREARSDLQNASTIRSRIVSSLERFDPFSAFGLESKRRGAQFLNQRFGAEPIMPGQAAFLETQLCTRGGWTSADIAKLTKREAQKLITEVIARRDKGKASFKQLAVLRKYGWEDTGLSIEQAKRAIDYVAAQHWDPKRVSMDTLCQVITGNGARKKPKPVQQKLPGVPEPINLLEWL